jgi:hypothetical protein
MVSFTLPPLYPQIKSSRYYPVDGRFGGFQNQYVENCRWESNLGYPASVYYCYWYIIIIIIIVLQVGEIRGSKGNDYEDYYRLECDAIQSGRSLQTFPRNLLPPSSEYKSKPSVGIPPSPYIRITFFMLGLLFHPEDEDSRFLRNAPNDLQDCMASHPGRPQSFTKGRKVPM